MIDPAQAFDMLQKMQDPQRKNTLHKPLIDHLNLTIQQHVERSRVNHPGAELCPPEVMDALTTVLAVFVVTNIDRNAPQGDVALSITKVLAQKIMRIFPIVDRLHDLFGKEPS
ncbi:hypothetical protein [Prosthecobacter sp.]|uniref:hypothetical protein n=1 Tax=Prosthecobacter sp. TaxID=1965333 RepID=UPI0037831990